MATAREHLRRPHRNGHAHMRDLARDAREEAEEYASNIADRTRGYVDASRDYVNDHPVKSLSVAAGIGLLAGMLLIALRSPRG